MKQKSLLTRCSEGAEPFRAATGNHLLTAEDQQLK